MESSKNIYTKKLVTTVECGYDGVGAIAVNQQTYWGGRGVLTINELPSGKESLSIGDSIVVKELKQTPRVEIVFNDEKSIDSFIEQLQKMKKDWRPYPANQSMYLAC